MFNSKQLRRENKLLTEQVAKQKKRIAELAQALNAAHASVQQIESEKQQCAQKLAQQSKNAGPISEVFGTELQRLKISHALETKSLKSENEKLKTELAQQNKNVDSITKVFDAELQRVKSAHAAELQCLRAENESLKTENKQLRARLVDITQKLNAQAFVTADPTDQRHAPAERPPDNEPLEPQQSQAANPDALQYSGPYVTLHIKSVSPERVVIQRIGEANATASEVTLPDHARVADALHPKQDTRWLDSWFPNGSTSILEGKFIGLLKEALAAEHHSCISGEIDALAAWKAPILPTDDSTSPPSAENAPLPDDDFFRCEPFLIDESLDESTFKAAPIPPKPSAPESSRTWDKPQTTSPSVATLSKQANYSALRFYEGAVKNVNSTECTAQFVPFFEYWPDYYSMQREQRRWYFYWRDKVRANQYLDTDLSYIFLYIYELINLVGCASPLDAYARMTTLWLKYRAAFPKLDGYLQGWVADFIHVHKLEGTVDPSDLPCLAGTANARILEALTNAPVRLEFSDLALLVDYNIARSKFYQSSNQALCERYLPEIVAVIDRYLETKKQRRLIDKFKPRKRSEFREVFRSALYALEPQKARFEWLDIIDNKGLRSFLTQVVRYTENSMRELTDFRGRLRGIELEADICNQINSYLKKKLVKTPEQIPSKAIVIDKAKLMQAQLDAESIRTLLTTEPVPENSVAPVPLEASTAPSPEIVLPERPEDTPEGLLTDLRPVAELLAQLSEAQTRLIHVLYDNNWEASAPTLQAALEGPMLLDSVIDDINAAAINSLDTVIVAHEGDLYVTEEDFRDELEFLIDFNAQQKQTLLWHAENMDPEWDMFCRQLTPVQVDALRLLSKNTEPPTAELQRLAHNAGTLLQPLLDGVNEIFMDVFGDILLQDNAILPDYIENLETLFLEDKAL